ncbi:MAG: universal stress protein [Acidimicrobiia bacterium]|nr:universal stress protein [Acidimicrobiia bacterium]
MSESRTATAEMITEDLGPIRHIGVCLDQSTIGDRVMGQAVSVARAFDARLTILHVLDCRLRGAKSAPTDLLEWELRRTQAQQYLESIQDNFSTSGLEISCQILEGRPPEEIRDWVSGNDIDLTALASHGGRGRTAWRLASTARKLVEGIAGSVFLVPADQDRATVDGPTYKRILVPLDGSVRAESVLYVAATMAQAHDGELRLLHVVPWPDTSCPTPFDDYEHDLDRRLVERNTRVARAYLGEVEQRLSRSGVRVKTDVAVDEVRGHLLRRIADDHVDLVIFSGHGAGGLAEVPFGSVAGFLLENANVPLLVMRDRTTEVHWTRSNPPAPATLRRPQTGP